jgi:tRNA A37 methylthiotransferase MiaB
MRGHVPEAVKKERSARMRGLSDTLMRSYVEQFMWATLPVLWEQVTGATEDGFINVGYTDNYIRVRSIHPRALVGHITEARLSDMFEDDMLIAEPLISQGTRE